LDDKTALIVDIGGGSVEFIIGNKERIFWKQSFEIGGQRLLERFMNTDPISPSAIGRLQTYFQTQLMPLANAIHQYQIGVLVGSSGSFDTLADIDAMTHKGQWPATHVTCSDLALEEFYRQYQLLTSLNRAERLSLPGMIPLRVDMIVVAMVLIRYLLESFEISHIRCSTYALKEGVMQAVFEHTLDQK
jgi:exopolyphosphatase / guanosine-5'-triphosphate,3'-diphosphate pyrophosphatase